MAKLTIRLILNPTTGKREIDVAYQSDADALPMEHEEEHRRLVEQIVGPLKNGALLVERGGDGEREVVALPEPPVPVTEREKLKQ